jgi:hypothetical protein
MAQIQHATLAHGNELGYDPKVVDKTNYSPYLLAKNFPTSPSSWP